jgi:hypothetical protein
LDKENKGNIDLSKFKLLYDGLLENVDTNTIKFIKHNFRNQENSKQFRQLGDQE